MAYKGDYPGAPPPYGAGPPGPYVPPGYSAPQPGQYNAQQPAPYGAPQPGPYAPNFPGGDTGYPYPHPQNINQGYAPNFQNYPGSPPQGGGMPAYQPQPYPAGGYAPPGFAPIVQQPGAAPGPRPTAPESGWMNIPQGPPNCPPGLEYLASIDQLLIHQKVEILEALIGFETNNKYTIKNSIGQKVYYAVEDTDCLTRNCCGPIRPFEIKILDNFKNQVMSINRPLACDSCCFPCCLQSIEISSPPGAVVGSVEQQWSICKPIFDVKDARGEVVLRIKGPICRFSICGDIEFQVLSKDGETQVGRITKQWSGMLREMFTDSDYFGVTFPLDLDPKIKATLLGATFLIDAMFFEKSGNKESDGIGLM